MPTVITNVEQETLDKLMQVRQEAAALTKVTPSQGMRGDVWEHLQPTLTAIADRLDPDLIERRNELRAEAHQAAVELAEAKGRLARHQQRGPRQAAAVKEWAAEKTRLQSEIDGYQSVAEAAAEAHTEANAEVKAAAERILNQMAGDARRAFETDEAKRKREAARLWDAYHDYVAESDRELKRLHAEMMNLNRFNRNAFDQL